MKLAVSTHLFCAYDPLKIGNNIPLPSLEGPGSQKESIKFCIAAYEF